MALGIWTCYQLTLIARLAERLCCLFRRGPPHHPFSGFFLVSTILRKLGQLPVACVCLAVQCRFLSGFTAQLHTVNPPQVHKPYISQIDRFCLPPSNFSVLRPSLRCLFYLVGSAFGVALMAMNRTYSSAPCLWLYI